MSFNRQELAERATALATHGVYVGTSSWKYPGWCGMLYDRARYEYRGKFAETRFKWDQTPHDIRLSLKVGHVLLSLAGRIGP